MKPYQVARFHRSYTADGPAPSHRPELGACHLWTASTYEVDGSPGTRRAEFSYMENGKRRFQNAARVAWKLAHGEPPRREYVCHECDNTLCVRLSHLYLGSAKSNMADRDSRGRHGVKGKRFAASCKLDPKEYIEIKARVASGESQTAVARSKGIHQSHVSNIVRGVRGQLDTVLVQTNHTRRSKVRGESALHLDASNATSTLVDVSTDPAAPPGIDRLG